MKFMETNEMSYTDALKRLEAIVKELQGENCDIDAMVGMTREAAGLINACRARLTTTEDELKKILEGLTTGD